MDLKFYSNHLLSYFIITCRLDMINWLVKYFQDSKNLLWYGITLGFVYFCVIGVLLKRKTWVYFDLYDWVLFVTSIFFLIISCFWIIVFPKYRYYIYGNKSKKIKESWKWLSICFLGFFAWTFLFIIYHFIYDGYVPGGEFVENVSQWMGGDWYALHYL